MEQKVCSVTSEQTQSSSRRISSLKDSSLLLTTERWTSQKLSPFICEHTAFGEDRKYISEHKQNAHNDGNRAQPLKRLFETLFLAIKKCTGFTTDVTSPQMFVKFTTQLLVALMSPLRTKRVCYCSEFVR